MIDYDPLEEFRDPQTYDLECEAYDEDRPLVEQWARTLGGPLLDLACGTGRMALRLAAQGYAVTGVPRSAVRGVVGEMWRVFGLQWLREGGRRAAGLKALDDERGPHAAERGQGQVGMRAGPGLEG